MRFTAREDGVPGHTVDRRWNQSLGCIVLIVVVVVVEVVVVMVVMVVVVMVCGNI